MLDYLWPKSGISCNLKRITQFYDFLDNHTPLTKPEDQWSCETLTWYLGQAQNKILFKMAQSFLRKASFNFQM